MQRREPLLCQAGRRSRPNCSMSPDDQKTRFFHGSLALVGGRGVGHLDELPVQIPIYTGDHNTQKSGSLKFQGRRCHREQLLRRNPHTSVEGQIGSWLPGVGTKALRWLVFFFLHFFFHFSACLFSVARVPKERRKRFN